MSEETIKMSEETIKALRETLKLENDLKLFIDTYGVETLKIILNNVGFFGQVGILNHEEVDKDEFEAQLKELSLSNSEPIHNNLGSDESSRPEDFGLYGEALKRQKAFNGDASIYAQDPEVMSKVEQDKESHPKLVPTDATIQEPMPSLNEDPSAHPKITPVETTAPVAMAEPEGVDGKQRKLVPSQEETRQNNLWGDIGSPVAPGQIKF